MKSKQIIGLGIIVIMIAGLSACATVSTDNPDAALIDARNALMAADVVYETTWQAFLNAHTQGLVSDMDLKLGKTLADAYDFAWTEAAKACELYLDNRDENARTQTVAALMEASRVLGELLGYIRAFIGLEVGNES